MSKLNKRYLIPGFAAGMLALILSIAFKSSPELQPGFDKARLVTVQPLALISSAPEALAYGRVAPKNSWQAIAEVSGKVVYRHPSLESGRALSAGTLVLKIDPLEYQLQESQAAANVAIADAQLTRIEQQQKNYAASIAIEQQKLLIEQQEYQRKLELKKKNLISNSEVEAQKQSLLVQKKLVEDLNSSLKLLPDDKKVAQAQLNINQAQLLDAQRQLANTEVRLPFDARIAEVNIEQAQAVTIGSSMFEAQQVGTVEVKAELSLQDARTLQQSIRQNNVHAVDIEKLGLTATIELQVANQHYQWPAKVTRIADNIDPNQATLGFYLEVEQSQSATNNKPLLTKGMFVSARIHGLASQQFMIPEKALHGETIYLLDKDNKLDIRQIQVDFRNSQGVAISGELDAQQQLILNDIIPAIAGMSLKTNQENAL